MSSVIEVLPLGFPWVTADPFLFCVHHLDAYPAGNEHLGPAVSLADRSLGQDFEGRDGFRMYHGTVVPGFPQHPHRGFETVTIVRSGTIDHSDSLGATARFGAGDVQWLTAGEGIVHCEMFPLVEREKPNPVELFQIWLNLPAKDKLVPPHFSMLWAPAIPRVSCSDDAGRVTTVSLIAGQLGDARAPSPPPHSWASHPDADVAIWSIELEPEAVWRLPRAAYPDTVRALYFFRGEAVQVGSHAQRQHAALILEPGEDVRIEAGRTKAELLLLQGRPIGEPIVQRGPFVMNTPAEIERAVADYQRTRFGGWPWKTDDPVHARSETRFAKHADGRIERPDH